MAAIDQKNRDAEHNELPASYTRSPVLPVLIAYSKKQSTG
jgi:hypothetical protein